MIGFWNYTVILTYFSLAISTFGMTMAIRGDILSALICLALSGFCDAFDGRVAASKTDRTDSEKLFGIQLDSLCDVVCFGFYPGLICYQMGIQSRVGIALIIFYVIAAVARLAYFNVLEIERSPEDKSPRVYHGLPVTAIAVIFPSLYFISYWVPFDFKPLVWELMLLATGGCFVANIKLPKPDFSQIILISIAVAGLFLTIPFLTMTI